MGFPITAGQTQQALPFFLAQSSDHIAGKTSATPTVLIRKPGGSFATPAGAVTETGHGWYEVAGNAADASTLGPLLLHAEASGADPFDDCFPVVAYSPLDATALGLSLLVDEWAVDLPGSYAGSQAGFIVGNLLLAAANKITGAGATITLQSLTSPISQDIKLTAGDGYYAIDGEGLAFDLVTTADLTGAAFTLRIYNGTVEGSGVFTNMTLTSTPGDTGYSLTTDVTEGQSSALGDVQKRRYEVVLERANDHVRTLRNGLVITTN